MPARVPEGLSPELLAYHDLSLCVRQLLEFEIGILELMTEWEFKSSSDLLLLFLAVPALCHDGFV